MVSNCCIVEERDAGKGEAGKDPKRQQSVVSGSAGDAGGKGQDQGDGNGNGNGSGTGGMNHDGDATSQPSSARMPPCSILQWKQWKKHDAGDVLDEGNGSIRTSTIDIGKEKAPRWRCERTELSTPRDLQDHLNNAFDEDKFHTQDTKIKPAGASIFLKPPALSPTRPTPLLMVHRLDPDFRSVLLASPTGVDLEFLEIHAGIRRPPVLRSSFASSRQHLASRATVATWSYPEMLSKMAGHTPLFSNDKWGNTSSDIRLYLLFDERRFLRLAFSHATLRVGGQVKENGQKQRILDVLLTESQILGQLPLQHKTSAHEQVIVNDKYPSIEQTLCEGWDMSTASRSSPYEDEINRLEAVEEAAYERWLDFFDVITPQVLRLEPIVSNAQKRGIPLAWHAMEELERNLAMSMALRHLALARKRRTGVVMNRDIMGPDWATLIRSLKTRVIMLPAIAPAPHSLPVPPVRVVSPPSWTRTRAPSPGSDATVSETDITNDTTQRALDRITYLGGILLPVSIVASILSMNDDYAPGSQLFWIFWVVALPLTFGTISFIYADKLRRVMVWQEIDDPEEEEDVAIGLSIVHDEQNASPPLSQTAYGQVDVTLPKRLKHPKGASNVSGNIDGLKAHSHAEKPVGVPVDDSAASNSAAACRPMIGASLSSPDFVIDVDRSRMRPASGAAWTGAAPPLEADRRRRRQRQRAWKKQELGWMGAAMCMLRLQNPQPAVGSAPGVSDGDRTRIYREVRPPSRSRSRSRSGRSPEWRRSGYVERSPTSSS
ncbi:hypothetical protein BD289DRAFT_432942 [Coniella lustricola]|uniref:Uncharacterized protein n=1 Tax=Coniella lustricola TaxID=2025994 RepID=A0A2T3A905_9PEZI|nr:hypothetical protein BD289DRAFT_432942 [Coniella lustricola]